MNKTIKFVVATFLLAVLFLSTLGSGTPASAQAAAQVRWEATVKMAPEASRLAIQDRSAWTDPLLKLGVSASVVNDQFSLKGQKDMAQASAALFDISASWLDFLGGSVELTITLPSDGNALTLNLEARNTTGYIWEVLPGDGVYVQSAESTFAMRHRGMGASAIQTIRLSATKTGDTSVRLLYRRPFEAASEPHARLNVWLTEAVDTLELSDPTPAVVAEEETPAVDKNNAYAELDELKTALPASWDWRTSGIVPAVRDQGTCGSCWAFGTVSVMESAVVKGGGPMTDLSEQFLISCNKDGWSCSGGLTATKYHYNVLGLNQTAAGAVLESVKPYTASNGTCLVALAHPYKASGWAFITGSEWTMPTNDALKNAIYTYGPITAGVCVDDGWYSYAGGTYVPTSNVCGGSTNHQIVLVGWDDADQTWILRNSWGPGWGDGGYMHIRWDPDGTTSRVGEGTSWVAYAPSVAPVLVSPSGTISDTTPTFNWKIVTNATQYRYQVYQGTTLKYTKTVPSSACGTTNCTNTPTTVLNYAAHKWHAQAYVGGVWKDYSAYKNFTVSTTPVLVSPVGTITDRTPAFKWKIVNGATQYRIQVYQGTVLKYTKTVPSSACGTTYCINTPTTALAFAAHKWRAQAFVGGVWKTYSLYKNFTVSAPNPTAGFWSSNTGDEFYVTTDRMNVDDFAIYISVTGCGDYKIVHGPLSPIVNKQFSFTGSFYASGTFDTTTSSHGTDGLSSFYLPYCGYVSGGPWSWTATWKHTTEPPLITIQGDNLVAKVDPALHGLEYFFHIVNIIAP